jgi:hypothetical protein
MIRIYWIIRKRRQRRRGAVSGVCPFPEEELCQQEEYVGFVGSNVVVGGENGNR